MKKSDFINLTVMQEDFDRRPMGNLSVGHPNDDPSKVTLAYYAAVLWGAQFAERRMPVYPHQYETRPAFEFVNVGKYSTSTSSNQRHVFSAIDNAPRKYTTCLVIDPIDTGGRHWAPPDDWTPMQVALDWCVDNGVRAGFGGEVSTPDNPFGWPTKRRALLRFQPAPRDLARLLNADNFWLLQTQERTP